MICTKVLHEVLKECWSFKDKMKKFIFCFERWKFRTLGQATQMIYVRWYWKRYCLRDLMLSAAHSSVSQKQGYCYQICVPDTCTRSTLTPSHHWVMRPWHKTCHKQRMPTLDMWGNVTHVDIFDDKQYRKMISFYEIKCFYLSALSISISWINHFVKIMVWFFYLSGWFRT